MMTISATTPDTQDISFGELVSPHPMVFSCKLFPFPEEQKHEAFQTIKKHLLSYPKASAEFDEKKFTIRLYHQEGETQALITHLMLEKYFTLTAISYTQAPTTMSFCARNVIMTLEYQGYAHFHAFMKNMMLSAKNFYASREVKIIKIPDDQQVEFSKIFSTLLKNHQGLCIGEYFHCDLSPKAHIIRNMEELRNLGVTTLYVEHLFYDTMYQSLAVDMDIPPHVKRYLKNLDMGHNVKSNRYTYSNLIQRAHEVGIRVVPIDTSASYACGNHRKKGIKLTENRVAGMNFVATRIIEEDQERNPGKFIALMGITHLVEFVEGIPGVSELIGVPSLLFKDGEESALTYNTITGDTINPVSLVLQTKIIKKVTKKRSFSDSGPTSPNKRKKT